MATRLFSVMGAFAEFERALIRERQPEGIALAKSRGLQGAKDSTRTNASLTVKRTRCPRGI